MRRFPALDFKVILKSVCFIDIDTPKESKTLLSQAWIEKENCSDESHNNVSDQRCFLPSNQFPNAETKYEK